MCLAEMGIISNIKKTFQSFTSFQICRRYVYLGLIFLTFKQSMGCSFLKCIIKSI